MDLCRQTDVSIELLTLYEYKQIKDLYRKAKTIKFSEENIGEKFQDTDLAMILHTTQKHRKPKLK